MTFDIKFVQEIFLSSSNEDGFATLGSGVWVSSNHGVGHVNWLKAWFIIRHVGIGSRSEIMFRVDGNGSPRTAESGFLADLIRAATSCGSTGGKTNL